VAWSNDAVVKWYGPTRSRGNDYVKALDAGRRGLPEAEQELRAAIKAPSYAPIARATALTLLHDYYSPASIDALQAGLTDPDAIVRTAAVSVLDVLPPADRVRLGRPLLNDPVRLVRAWTASALAGTPPDLLTQDEAADLARATQEYLAIEMAVAERPEAHLNLSGFYLRQGKTKEAEAALQTALRLDPRNVPARVNLADAYRATGREADAERVLRQAITLEPAAAEAIHALGLLCVREKRQSEALGLFKRACELQPNVARYGYVYAISLQSSGDIAKAIDVLEAVHKARPTDVDTLAALATFERDRGNVSAAIGWADTLVRLRPDDAGARSFLTQLKNVAAATRR
jgi:tetratricopeptide (TPR) repeat protein